MATATRTRYPRRAGPRPRAGPAEIGCSPSNVRARRTTRDGASDARPELIEEVLGVVVDEVRQQLADVLDGIEVTVGARRQQRGVLQAKPLQSPLARAPVAQIESAKELVCLAACSPLIVAPILPANAGNLSAKSPVGFQ